MHSLYIYFKSRRQLFCIMCCSANIYLLFPCDFVLLLYQVGTPLYMSPEVLRGDGYDFQSDVWSIGCLLYELVGGKWTMSSVNFIASYSVQI